MIFNQVGSLSKSVSYREAYGYVKAPEYDAEIKISLADLFAMTIMMAINEEISLTELFTMAQDRLDEFIKTRLPRK